MMGYADPRCGTVSSDLRRNGLAHPCVCTTLSSFLVQTKIQGESKPEARPLGYVEDFDESRTKLAGIFSSLQVGLHEFAENIGRIGAGWK